ncbi:MAG TPA: DUF1800 domain-containing protein [Tepidisphaeraceae bacterium]|jgi:uncharacterized protein (DUF1800 family)
MSANWEPYRPIRDEPWDVRRVAHLHRCAGFAATYEQIQRDLRDGPDAAVSRVIEGKSPGAEPRAKFEDLSHELADAAIRSGDAERLKAWWLFRMLFTPDPLAERLTLMWHNHFATSNAKVDDLAAMHRQNETFRKLGRSRFGELLRAILRDPALLVWLDAPANRKGKTNENLGRELLELFTLGAGHFSEDDVKQTARALTGLSASENGFRFVAEWHDAGTKTILGTTKAFDPDSLCDLLLAHPATAHRVAWRICTTFLGQNVASDADISALAEGLRDHDPDIGWAVQTVVRSRLFFSETNLGAQVIGPPEFLVGTARALGMFDPPPSTLLLADWSRRLGQDLFYPPNVGGWAGGTAWLTTHAVLSRANFGAALLHGQVSATGAAPDLSAIAQRAGIAASVSAALPVFNDLLACGQLSDAQLKSIADRAGDSLTDAVAMLLATPEAQLA